MKVQAMVHYALLHNLGPRSPHCGMAATATVPAAGYTSALGARTAPLRM